MYYDRTLPDALIATLRANASMRRLVELCRSPWGARHLAHVEFRRSAGNEWGSIQFYAGRTSLLSVKSSARGRLELSAHPKYTAVASELFGTSFDGSELASLADSIEAYLSEVVAIASRAFTGGEGGVHAGFVRRYGLGFAVGDPFLAVDKEVKVGFPNRAATQAFHTELEARFGVVHRELDSLGVLDDGNIAVVELKAERESLEVAAVQAATHVLTLGKLLGGGLAGAVEALVAQKVSVGLMPDHAPRLGPMPRLVPVIAAPDGQTDWASQWRRGVADVIARHPDLMRGLRMWRLSETGEILERLDA